MEEYRVEKKVPHMLINKHLVKESDSQSSRSSKETSFLGFTCTWNTIMTMNHKTKSPTHKYSQKKNLLRDELRSSDSEKWIWNVWIRNQTHHSDLILKWLLSSLQQRNTLKKTLCHTSVTIWGSICPHLRNHQISTQDNCGSHEGKKERKKTTEGTDEQEWSQTTELGTLFFPASTWWR